MATQYKRTGVGYTNVHRDDDMVKGFVGSYGGANGDEVHLLNGLIALGYDPALVRSLSDADPNRRFLGDAVTRALRIGVSRDDIKRALAFDKVAIEDHSPGRAANLAAALGLDTSKIGQAAARLAGQQGRKQPTAQNFIDAVSQVGGLNPDAAQAFGSYASSQQGMFLAKGEARQGQPPAYGGQPAPDHPATPPSFGGPVNGPSPSAASGIAPYRSDIKLPPQTGTKAPPGPGAGAGAGGPGGPGAADKGLPPNATDAQVIKYFQENYGADAWMMQIPDFVKIARQVATGGGGQWSDEMITSAVQKTPWWQSNGQNVFNFMQAQADNGRWLNDQILSKQQTLDQKASQFGITLDPQRTLEIATNWQKFGWDDNALNATLSNEFHYQSNKPSVFTDNLKAQAKSQLVPLDDGTVEAWAKKIIANPQATNDFTEFLKQQAVSKFPPFADRLNGGETMKDISGTYAQIAGQTLQMDPNNVDFSDPKWLKSLDQVDPKTGQHTSMSYSDWTNTLKSDPIYGYDKTDNAKQAAMSTATDIMRKFGAIA